MTKYELNLTNIDEASKTVTDFLSNEKVASKEVQRIRLSVEEILLKYLDALNSGSDLIIDPAKRQVFLKGKELVFTKKEFDLLLCLASHPGRVFSREQLYDYVWDDKIVFNVDSVIKTHISSLRQKMIDAVVEYIKNVWGLGYKFNNEE